MAIGLPSDCKSSLRLGNTAVAYRRTNTIAIGSFLEGKWALVYALAGMLACQRANTTAIGLSIVGK